MASRKMRKSKKIAKNKRKKGRYKKAKKAVAVPAPVKKAKPKRAPGSINTDRLFPGKDIVKVDGKVKGYVNLVPRDAYLVFASWRDYAAYDSDRIRISCVIPKVEERLMVSQWNKRDAGTAIDFKMPTPEIILSSSFDSLLGHRQQSYIGEFLKEESEKKNKICVKPYEFANARIDGSICWGDNRTENWNMKILCNSYWSSPMNNSMSRFSVPRHDNCPGKVGHNKCKKTTILHRHFHKRLIALKGDLGKDMIEKIRSFFGEDNPQLCPCEFDLCKCTCGCPCCQGTCKCPCNDNCKIKKMHVEYLKNYEKRHKNMRVSDWTNLILGREDDNNKRPYISYKGRCSGVFWSNNGRLLAKFPELIRKARSGAKMIFGFAFLDRERWLVSVSDKLVLDIPLGEVTPDFSK